jgi:hypothetical protein
MGNRTGSSPVLGTKIIYLINTPKLLSLVRYQKKLEQRIRFVDYTQATEKVTTVFLYKIFKIYHAHRINITQA